LQHFWGPLSNIKSTAWICDSAAWAARQAKPNFFYIYLPHLDYAAQKFGPDSEQAQRALVELDAVIGKLIAAVNEAYAPAAPLWLVASEYTIVPVNHVVYPNRMLREAGLLAVVDGPEGEQLDYKHSRAWALVDHQLAHVFVQRDEDVPRVAALFEHCEGIDEVLTASQLDQFDLKHQRAGEVVLVSAPNSWQAYYWWLDDARAPKYARTVDIHRKPGYDPVEMHLDMATKSIPLDATLVRGSHGAPARDEAQRGIILASEKGVLVGREMADTDVCELVLRQFGV
jgi:predicted AlkP superfamily pyrophosphatase or phosphodiesterase